MKKEKEFDCVQMKWDIQQIIQQEYENIEDIQAHNHQISVVLANPILGPFMKKISKKKNRAESNFM
ncbi:MAG: hypothetical protein HY960_09315 [Ignavibacteriae bacterium]|nr:hypothetical protein [Ignavibacteriota bacterium]